MIDHQLIADFRELALNIAPELRAVPLYILTTPPPSMPRPLQTAAYAARIVDHKSREHLENLNLWRGWGPAIVFCDMQTDLHRFLAIGIHELAHVLPTRPLPNSAQPTPEQLARNEEYIQQFAAADPEPMKLAEPWVGHSADFVRRALHLHYRALWEGITLPYTHLDCGGPRYGLSPVWRYVSALGAEPFDLRSRTFAEIESTPAPDAFLDLFANDVAAWRGRTK